jgi:hypothetical protein
VEQLPNAFTACESTAVLPCCGRSPCSVLRRVPWPAGLARPARLLPSSPARAALTASSRRARP